MAEFLLEINDAGDTLEINDSADQLLILDDTITAPAVGGGEGGRSTQKGVSVFDQDRSLGERPIKKAPAKSEAKLLVHVEAKSKGLILIPLKAFSESLITKSLGRGISVSKIMVTEKIHTIARIRLQEKFESYGYIHRGELIANATKLLTKTTSHLEKLRKLTKLSMLFNLAESIDSIYKEQKPKKFKTFDFEESPEQWQGILTEQKFKAFTHSSSFVGNVRYDQDEQSMRILLNGTPYKFCGVPERTFDSFQGADSKGAFFARNIKGQFNC